MRQLFVLGFLLLMAVGAGISQKTSPATVRAGGAGVGRGATGDPGATDPQFRVRRNEPEPADKQLERQHNQQMNKDRQAAIKRDTDKLLALATELKEYVDKSNENVLSLDVVRKAEEIEKLARHVKEKMKE